MAMSEMRGMMGLGPSGWNWGDGFNSTPGVTAPGMNTQPYYKPNPLGLPGAEEEPPYDNQGMRNASWDDFKNKDAREALRKNPYGALPSKEGGGRTWVDWARKEGRDFADPNTMSDFMKLLSGYRGAWNPDGKQSPYHRAIFANKNGLNSTGHGGFLKDMSFAERHRYAKARYSYDNGLRGGLSDVNTYENKRNMEAANPGSTAKLRPWKGGVWERDGTLEVPEQFKLPKDRVV